MDTMERAEMVLKLSEMIRTLEVLRVFLQSLLDDLQKEPDGGENG